MNARYRNFTHRDLANWARMGYAVLSEAGVSVEWNQLELDGFRDDGEIATTDQVLEAAGYCKFLQELGLYLVQFPRLEKLFRRNITGDLPSRSALRPFQLYKRTKTPQRAEALLAKLRNQVSTILNPYGIGPSWWAIAKALDGSQGTPKGRNLAKYIAALSIAKYLGNDQVTALVDDGLDVNELLIRARGLERFIGVDPVRQSAVAFAVRSGEYPSLREALQDAERWKLDSINGKTILVDQKRRWFYHGCFVAYCWSFTEWEPGVFASMMGAVVVSGTRGCLVRMSRVQFGWEPGPELIRQAIRCWDFYAETSASLRLEASLDNPQRPSRYTGEPFPLNVKPEIAKGA